MTPLNNKTAVVTGGSRGIGAAIARRLARDGANVVITYRKEAEAAAQVVAACREAGGRALAVQADVAEPAAMASVFEQTLAEFGHLNILVNNAAIAQFLPLAAVTPEHFDNQFAINVRGLLFATQAAVKVMADGGRIINITSGAAEAAGPGASVYSASKAAVQVLSKSWASELGSRGITVNCVSPGITETEMVHGVIPQEALDAMVHNTALGRIGRPDDIAGVVAFLATDDAGWVTGAIIGANGGLR
jgi:3-oxoacyl-[acyl-carrier protein] reductase